MQISGNIALMLPILRPDSVKAIDRRVKDHGGKIDRLAFVPALLKNGRFAAVLDSGSGEVVDRLAIDP